MGEPAKDTMDNLFGSGDESASEKEQEKEIADEKEKEKEENTDMDIDKDADAGKNAERKAGGENGESWEEVRAESDDDLFGDNESAVDAGLRALDEPGSQESNAEQSNAGEDLFGELQDLDGAMSSDGENRAGSSDEEEDLRGPPEDEAIFGPASGLPLLPGGHDDSDIEHHMLRLPRLVNLERQLFDSATFKRDKQGFIRPEQGRTADVVDSVIRYRRKAEKLESNARVVRWSDGSLTLHVGDLAHFVDRQQDDLSARMYAAVVESEHLTRCERPVSSRWHLRPTSLMTAADRTLTAAVASHKAKVRAKFHNPTVDPELEQAKEEKEYAQTLRAQQRLEKDKARKRERGAATSTISAGADLARPRQSIAAMSRSRYYSDSEEEEGGNDYDSMDSADSEKEFRDRAIEEARSALKRTLNEEEEDEARLRGIKGGAGNDSEGSDAEAVASRPRKSARRVLADSEDEFD